MNRDKDSWDLWESWNDGKTSRVMDYVHLVIEDAISSWLSLSHEGLENLLQKYSQEAESVADVLDAKDMPAYYLGQMEGTLSVLRRLMYSEKKRQNMFYEMNGCSSKFAPIMEKLYQAGEAGMTHGELANAICVSKSSLTGIMKEIVHSGAVDMSRSGENTHYVLSDEGRRFQENRQETFSGKSRPDIKRASGGDA